MRLLVFAESFHPKLTGGAGKAARDLAVELTRQGLHIDVVAPNRDRNVGVVELPEGIRVFDLPLTSKPYTKRMMRQSIEFLAQHIDFTSIDLVHDNGGSFRELFPLEIELVDQHLDAPLLVQFQTQFRPILNLEGVPDDERDFLVGEQRALAHRADHIVFLSEDERREGIDTFGLDTDAHSVIPNGILVSESESVATDQPPLILMAGRLSAPAKGLASGLAALDRIANKAKFDVLFVGGDLTPEAVPPSLRSRATIEPWLDEDAMRTTLQCASILLMPSLYEPFGLLAAEAQAARVPVVATAVGGLKEIIAHNETGLLADPWNAEEELANHLLTLLRNPKLREDFGRRGQDRVRKRYTIEGVAANTIKLFDHVLTNPSRANPRSVNAP